MVVANNVITDITGGYGVQIWGDFDDSWVINNTVYAPRPPASRRRQQRPRATPTGR